MKRTREEQMDIMQYRLLSGACAEPKSLTSILAPLGIAHNSRYKRHADALVEEGHLSVHSVSERKYGRLKGGATQVILYVITPAGEEELNCLFETFGPVALIPPLRKMRNARAA